jgi:hypothetical protein
MDNPPWDADLLDWLAADLADHDYDLKHTLRLILASRAYALPATGLDEADEAYVFRGPAVRRLSAEQFVDAVSQLTGVWHSEPAVQLPDDEPADDASETEVSVSEPSVGVRAALVAADALQRALGRPNREQVVTSRPQAATTLEALELTNGPVLAERLRQGAERLLKREKTTTDALVADLYLRAIAREPTPAERAAAVELVGSPPTSRGVEDLLWILVMLPEFQLIY